MTRLAGYTPISYTAGHVRIPVRFHWASYLYEGPHDAFWIAPADVTSQHIVNEFYVTTANPMHCTMKPLALH